MVFYLNVKYVLCFPKNCVSEHKTNELVAVDALLFSKMSYTLKNV